jgi:uncharacterized membrane protein YdjX (TVP38/TMEM64 family)
MPGVRLRAAVPAGSTRVDPTGGTGAGPRRARGGYLLVTTVLAALTLLPFGLVEWAGVPLLTDPVPALRAAGAWAALIGIGLLAGDVLLPVASSLVMVANGALFGLLPGAALSVLGGVGATLVGFLLGRQGRGVVERVTTPEQRRRADRLLDRWGPVAVAGSRAVPVLGETVAVLAGTSPMRWYVAAGAGLLGTVAPALLYSAAGARGGGAVVTVLVFALVAGLGLLLGAVLTAVRHLVVRRTDPARGTHDGPLTHR